jgi:hypothetical protein
MEFPKFDGADDHLPWLNHCERFFHVRQTLDDKKVAFAAFYLLDDAQLWFHWSSTATAPLGRSLSSSSIHASALH